jgi:hypothetical protein
MTGFVKWIKADAGAIPLLPHFSISAMLKKR